MIIVTGQISSFVKNVIIFKIMVQAWHNVLLSQGIC